MARALALKYRPSSWEDVTEQEEIVDILGAQISSGEFKHAYLFCGAAGTGKTTCARIFANEINHRSGVPIEMDAASKNGVDDVRDIIQNARLKPIDGDYKVFIIDECHAFSNNAWQAMLKIIEEPPATAVFIFCTTDPQKIPKTILSRVQRYDFQRISQQGIVERLTHITDEEYGHTDAYVPIESLEYIAKIADGGMRDAITLLDKCIAYSSELTLENVIKVIGAVDYDTMFSLTSALAYDEAEHMIEIIEKLHDDGRDLKQFVKSYTQFILDVNKYFLNCDWSYIQIPQLAEYEQELKNFADLTDGWLLSLLSELIKLGAEIKYSGTAKYDIEATFLVFMAEEGK